MHRLSLLPLLHYYFERLLGEVALGAISVADQIGLDRRSRIVLGVAMQADLIGHQVSEGFPHEHVARCWK